eukprot:Colp12_sorted_trinity150504_noHs@4542
MSEHSMADGKIDPIAPVLASAVRLNQIMAAKAVSSFPATPAPPAEEQQPPKRKFTEKPAAPRKSDAELMPPPPMPSRKRAFEEGGSGPKRARTSGPALVDYGEDSE